MRSEAEQSPATAREDLNGLPPLGREDVSTHLPIRQVAFVVTERCNLRCTYCYEAFKNKRRRPFPPGEIKRRIESELLADNGFEYIWFIFFGGEPLLRFDTIRDVVEWTQARHWPGKRYRFMIETNATLLDDAKKRWLAERKDDVILSVSLDGSKAAHDRNRSNSYDKVIRHAPFLRETWPTQPVKMTIGPETIADAYEGVVSVAEHGLNAEFDVLFENVWGDRESERRFVRIWADQLAHLVEFYAARPDLPRPSVLSRKLHHLYNVPLSFRRTTCGAGHEVTCFSPDGQEYPCFRFSPLVVSNPIQNLDSAPVRRNLRCASCPFEKICTSCEGHNYEANGSIYERTDFHCNFFKISMLASAEMSLRDRPIENPGSALEGLPVSARVDEMRRLLAIRLVNDECGPVLDWAKQEATAH